MLEKPSSKYLTLKSREEKETKETELYNVITSDNFVGRIEEIHFVQDRLLNLQEREEKNHQTLWKERAKYIEKIMEDIIFLTNQIDVITTSNLTFQQ